MKRAASTVAEAALCCYALVCTSLAESRLSLPPSLSHSLSLSIPLSPPKFKGLSLGV